MYSPASVGSGGSGDVDPEKQEGPIKDEAKALSTSGVDRRGEVLTYATTFLTQFEPLAGREWKILCQ